MFIDGQYMWDYFASVTFLYKDGTTRDVEYHLSLPEEKGYLDGMLGVISLAQTDVKYGEIILKVEMI